MEYSVLVFAIHYRVIYKADNASTTATRITIIQDHSGSRQGKKKKKKAKGNQSLDMGSICTQNGKKVPKNA